MDSLRAALGWIAANRAQFLFSGRPTIRGAKPAIELGVMLYALARPGACLIGPDDAHIRDLVGLFAQLGKSDAVRRSPPRSTSDMLLHATIVGILRWAGQQSSLTLSPLRAALQARLHDHSDRLPYHVMEERLFLEWVGLEPALPSLCDLARQSLIARRMTALQMKERAAYQLTHDIVFLAALDPLVGVPDEASLDIANLREVLADLLVCFAAEQHWDLLGELLLCWDCLRLPQDGLYARSWDIFLAQQDADGSLPGPVPPDGAPEYAPGDEARRFRDRYHTTLVFVLACNGRIRRESLRLAPVPVASPWPALAPSPWIDAARDASWLASLLERPDAGAPEVGCGVLVGTWLCAALDDEVARTLPAVTRRVAGLLACAERVEAVAPSLLLAAHALMGRSGYTAAPLAAYVERIGSVLDEVPPLPAEDDLQLCEKRVLLHQLGLAARPPAVDGRVVQATMMALPLAPTREQLSHALLVAGSATGYGTLDRHGDLASSTLLSRHAVSRLRASDVATGCALLRAAHHLHPLPSERVDDFVADLVLRQGINGGYGHLVTAEALPFDLDIHLHLPTTLTCLWTLAELRTGLRLYASLAGPHPLRVTSPILETGACL